MATAWGTLLKRAWERIGIKVKLRVLLLVTRVFLTLPISYYFLLPKQINRQAKLFKMKAYFVSKPTLNVQNWGNVVSFISNNLLKTVHGKCFIIICWCSVILRCKANSLLSIQRAPNDNIAHNQTVLSCMIRDGLDSQISQHLLTFKLFMFFF